MKLLLLVAIFGAAILASHGNVSSSPAPSEYDFIVDNTPFDLCKMPKVGNTNYLYISDAVDAATTQDQTIFVCAGTYDENLITMDTGGVVLTGPGATPEDDGTAVVRKVEGAPYNDRIFLLTADSVAVRGFHIDGTPPFGWPNVSIKPVYVDGNYQEVSDNTITNPFISQALILDGFGTQVLRNTITNSTEGAVFCECDSNYISQNNFGRA